MKVFLCGGGCGEQTKEAIGRLDQVIDHSKPCLYIPLAMEAERYDSCYEWIGTELGDVTVPEIRMVRSAQELAKAELADYSFVFIGGGNTFKLLKDLKESGAFEHLKEYLENGGIVFGGSAGAIIFGKDIETAGFLDENEVGLKDTEGFDILDGISVFCHYTAGSEEENERSRQYLTEASGQQYLTALPEEMTLFVNDGTIEAIGDCSFYCFRDGGAKEKTGGREYCLSDLQG